MRDPYPHWSVLNLCKWLCIWAYFLHPNTNSRSSGIIESNRPRSNQVSSEFCRRLNTGMVNFKFVIITPPTASWQPGVPRWRRLKGERDYIILWSLVWPSILNSKALKASSVYSRWAAWSSGPSKVVIFIFLELQVNYFGSLPLKSCIRKISRRVYFASVWILHNLEGPHIRGGA